VTIYYFSTVIDESKFYERNYLNNIFLNMFCII